MDRVSKWNDLTVEKYFNTTKKLGRIDNKMYTRKDREKERKK